MVGTTVADLSASTRFFVDVLGFAVEGDRPIERSGRHFELLHGLFGMARNLGGLMRAHPPARVPALPRFTRTAAGYRGYDVPRPLEHLADAPTSKARAYIKQVLPEQ